METNNYSELCSEVTRIFDGVLKGRILTLIDASIENERQCTALKDRIKGDFREMMNVFYEVSSPLITPMIEGGSK